MSRYKLWPYGLPLGWACSIPGHNQRVEGRIRRSPEFTSWHAMLTRCYIPDREHNEQYSVQGVKVAARWMGTSGFDTFFKDMGQRPPGTTLDRIDPWSDYTPDNCRWADATVQRNNQRRNHGHGATISVQNSNKRKRAS